MKTDIMNKAGNFLKKAGFKFKEARPDILLGVGSILVLAGTIMACKKTREAEPIIDHTKEELEELKKISETAYAEEKPTFVEYLRVYTRAGIKLVKVYIVSGSLYIGGMICIFGAHGELKTKNGELLAGSFALKKLFDEYRALVRKELGEEAERDLYFNVAEEEFEVEEEDKETGEIKTVKKKGKVFKKPQPGSMWARNFTPRTTDEFDVRSYNEFFIQQVTKTLNKDLKMVPFITINEVYDRLNMKPGEGKCAEGMTVGWVWNPKIDRGDREIKIEMLEGWEEVYDPIEDRIVVQPCLRLDFNCYPLEGLV